MKLGTYNLIAHIATVKECGDKFTADLVNYYPLPLKHKWWQKLRKQKDPFRKLPVFTLPGLTPMPKKELPNPPVGPDFGVKIDHG